MTHIHSDECCISMQYNKSGDEAPPPFAMWRYYKDQLTEALNEEYFTAEASFYYDDDAKQPMILVVVTGATQEEMEERFGKFMTARKDYLGSIFSGRSEHDGADHDHPESDEAGLNTEAVNDLTQEDLAAHHS